MRKLKYLSVLSIIIVGFIPLFDVFHPGLPLTHDGQDHVARISNFYGNLLEGNIIPRWAGNLNWGYGHPILMFLYPLPSYAASFFHFLGFSLIDSTKIVFGLAFILSGITMYIWIHSFLGKTAGLVAGILYMFAPYRFVDLYVRGAIGEHVAFIFPPLICYFMYRIYQSFRHSGESRLNRDDSRISTSVRDSGQARMTINNWYLIGGSLSLAGFILSHNAIALMFFPLIFIYALYILWRSKNKMPLAISYTLFAMLGLGLSAFFWIPAFFEGKYTLRDIVTAGEYSSRFTEFSHFIYSQWSFGGSGELSLQIGIIHWAILILTMPVVYILYKKKNNLWILGSVTFLIFWLTIFLMMSLSKVIWDYITVLQKFQFPWRFMSVSVFSIALLGGMFVHFVPNKFKAFVTFCFIVLVLFFYKDFWHAKGYLQKPESFFTGIYNGTTDTGESSPIWSVRFMEKRPKAHMEVVSGEAVVKDLSRKSTVHVYEIDASQKSRILENTLYFPGWNVFVDKRKADIEFQDPAHRGLMTFFVDKGEHNVEVKFGETKLRLFSNAISGASLVILFFYIILNGRVWRRFQWF